MVDRIAEARRVVATASEETDEATIREQLNSIERGLSAVAEEPDDAEKGARLEEVESKLVGLADETDDGSVEGWLADARDHIDAYRRDVAQDW